MHDLVTEYEKALNFLYGHVNAGRLTGGRNEIMAVITHWLESRNDRPIFYELADAQEWNEALTKFAMLESRPTFFDDLPGDGQVKAQLRISYDSIPFLPHGKPKFTFYDLFAGIGGFRLALQEVGGKCVFSCDWDRAARITYYRNYGTIPFSNVKQFTSSDLSDDDLTRILPDHNILAAGFPCQPFSRAGKSARISLGQDTGFNCDRQGDLFFDIIKIARVKKPDVIFLENVKSIVTDDGGRTLQAIKETIEEDLGYDFKYAIMDASSLVPQHRERCYIVCFRHKGNDFEFPKLRGASRKLSSILEQQVAERYTISDKLWQGHRERSRRNVERGTGFTAYLANLGKPSSTLVSRYGKDGKGCLIPQDGKNPRKLTPRECARLQGFPDNFALADSDASSYRQFGNAVPVPVVARIARNIVRALNKIKSINE